MLDLQQLQHEHREWLRHNFPQAEPWEALMGALEELGELAHAHLKGFNHIRGLSNAVEINAKKADAIGDVVIYLTSYCNTNDLDLATCVEVAWSTVKHRNWQVNTTDGSV